MLTIERWISHVFLLEVKILTEVSATKYSKIKKMAFAGPSQDYSIYIKTSTIIDKVTEVLAYAVRLPGQCVGRAL